jgi:hypothetical protein
VIDKSTAVFSRRPASVAKDSGILRAGKDDHPAAAAFGASQVERLGRLPLVRAHHEHLAGGRALAKRDFQCLPGHISGQVLGREPGGYQRLLDNTPLARVDTKACSMPAFALFQ